jgi:hypothetical protein
MKVGQVGVKKDRYVEDTKDGLKVRSGDDLTINTRHQRGKRAEREIEHRLIGGFIDTASLSS